MKLSKNNKNLSISKQKIIDIEQTLISLADNENIIADNEINENKSSKKHKLQ